MDEFLLELKAMLEAEVADTEKNIADKREAFGECFTPKVISYYNGRKDVAKTLLKKLEEKK